MCCFDLIKIHLPAKTVYVECEMEQPNDGKEH